jgi:GNAT superfamily N-acetyltransferase
MTPEPWTPALLPAFARFWNRAFAAKKNYFPVDAETLRRRLFSRGASGVVVARDGGEIVGFAHGVRRPEALCRSLDPSWPGGAQGVVAFLYVEPSHRRRGIGDALWHAVLGRFRGVRQVVLDGQCLAPGYGNAEGPFTPLWGTPEGVAVEWGDSASKKFLARKGFAPRAKGVHLAAVLPEGEGPDLSGPVGRLGLRLERTSGRLPELGLPWEESRPVRKGLDFEAVGAVRRGRTAGLFVAFPMKEVSTTLWAVYEASVAEDLRGKALGRRLLQALLSRIRARGGRQVEVLTLPEIAPAAHKLYLNEGFAPVASWALY